MFGFQTFGLITLGLTTLGFCAPTAHAATLARSAFEERMDLATKAYATHLKVVDRLRDPKGISPSDEKIIVSDYQDYRNETIVKTMNEWSQKIAPAATQYESALQEEISRIKSKLAAGGDKSSFSRCIDERLKLDGSDVESMTSDVTQYMQTVSSAMSDGRDLDKISGDYKKALVSLSRDGGTAFLSCCRDATFAPGQDGERACLAGKAHVSASYETFTEAFNAAIPEKSKVGKVPNPIGAAGLTPVQYVTIRTRARKWLDRSLETVGAENAEQPFTDLVRSCEEARFKKQTKSNPFFNADTVGTLLRSVKCNLLPAWTTADKDYGAHMMAIGAGRADVKIGNIDLTCDQKMLDFYASQRSTDPEVVARTSGIASAQNLVASMRVLPPIAPRGPVMPLYSGAFFAGGQVIGQNVDPLQMTASGVTVNEGNYQVAASTTRGTRGSSRGSRSRRSIASTGAGSSAR